ncbi:SDR family oxidoreductase [Gordonia hankookensis]|uniref:SDR family oxidoreductase n=1 Tax=Gordonia hankookensis TaxID=589403 RepID=A0ABR7WI96_9ACTN|nr:SDR family oxidoreductase [Gordonia hankookensis]MBD1322490.1 SDR family oxidoreductase [Gordonia hankookensis]
MVDWRKSSVTNGGVHLAVFEVAGSAEPGVADPRPTVLLIHGWPDTHHLWTHVAPVLAEDFRVVAYDSRGFGESDRPDGDDAYRLSVLADDLFAVAEAVSPDGPVHIVAHDWGSVQAWEAVTRPGAEQRIGSFVSVSGPNLDYLADWARDNLSRPTPRKLGRALAQASSSSYTVFFQLPVLPKMFFSVAGTPAVWREFLHRVEGTPRENVVVADTLGDDMISGLRLYRANIRQKLRNPESRPTAVPVLEVVNERDIALRPAIFADTYRHAQRLWRRNTPTGHWLPYTRPGYLADVAREFIATHSTGSRTGTSGRMDRARVFSRPNPLSGKLAVVTGAGSGIGRATARALAERGCELVLADIDTAAVEETAQESKAAGASASPYELDVSDTAAVTDFADVVRARHGVPDIVVNNAGIGLAGGALDATDEQIDRLLDVNLRGVVSGSRAFGRQMVERGVGGHIVNIASAAAFTPQRTLGVYAASKAGVLLFSESLRAELAEHRIGVTAICPGIVDTAIVANTPIAGLDATHEAAERDRLAGWYRRRGFTPDRVADDIVRAIIRDKAVVPVTAEAKIGYRIYRFTPWLSRFAARQKVTR